MIADRNRVYDGWTSLEAGVDFGRTPTLLEPNQCASAENMVFRGGHPAPRPGIRKIAEIFTNPNHSYYAVQTGSHQAGDEADEQIEGQEASTNYATGILQCAIGYSPHHGDDCIMSMIGGRLYKIVPGGVRGVSPDDPNRQPASYTANVTEIPLAKRNRNDLSLSYMLQADKWLVAQDNDSQPILYDGNRARRATVTNDENETEIPVGSVMAYGMGRIVVVVNKRDVAFGDLYGSHDDPDPANSIVKFTERNFLAEGFDAAIPFQQGLATGMAFFPQLDTSTGNGQLFVFAERGASSFFLSLPREAWKTSQFQVVALLTTGVRGHRSICVANEDLWFRSEDGMRSYRQARSEAQGWAHIPISTNVRQFLDVDTPWLLKFSSAIYFNNRVICTTSPIWNNGRVTHEGMVAVDFDILSSFGGQSTPAWDGHWQKQHPLGKPKVHITQLLTGNFGGLTRAFMFGIDELGHNQLYELTANEKDDWDGEKFEPIEWELVSRSFDFGKVSQQGSPFSEYEVYDADIWLREIIE
jgi:hypothetical protein